MKVLSFKVLGKTGKISLFVATGRYFNLLKYDGVSVCLILKNRYFLK